MIPSETTAVIGLGLMGGSLARDLAALGIRVVAHDIEPDVVAAAVAAGIVAEPLDATLQGVTAASLVVIATPVDAALETLAAIAPHLASSAVVTDVGSVKRPIIDRARELGIARRFVGSHPLTGDHRSGWSASRGSLFAHTPIFLCPTEDSAPDAIATVRTLWDRLGGKVEEIDADSHDLRMAWLSHLPQIASSALAMALRNSHLPADQLGPGGRDATRLAASSPAMWSAISTANAAHIAAAIDELQQTLGGFRKALDDRDAVALQDLFERAKDWRS